MPNPKSTAKIAEHPIHPMLIPFPIACFVLALISDLAFWNTSNDFRFAVSGEYGNVVASLSLLATVPVETVELAMQDRVVSQFEYS